jgi:hypothetical protein
MEAWEQMLDFQLGEIDETWEKYLEEARPLQVRHELAGAPTDSQIDRLRVQYKHLLEQGRQEKRAGDWAGWERGTDVLIEACEKAAELHDAVKESLAAAAAYQREQRRDRRTLVMWIAGLLIAALLAFGGGYALAQITDDEKPEPRDPSQQQRQPGGMPEKQP